MNNNSIQIDRYLQNEMDTAEKAAFETRLQNDAELREELTLQQQIINAAMNAGLKQTFGKAIKQKILTRRLINGTIILIIAAISFYIVKTIVFNDKTATVRGQLIEKFEISNATDTIIETKDGIVFAIPAHAFRSDAATIQLEIKTALNAHDIIQNGLSTMSNDAMLQTAGMFYINGTADGKTVELVKQVSVSVPATTINPGMQLFDGIAGADGHINWVNPKPVDRSLRTYDITTLDFYPPKYIPALKALQKDYTNKIYTDSLYYSFSGYPRPTATEPVENEMSADGDILNRGDSTGVDQGNGDRNDFLDNFSDTTKKLKREPVLDFVTDSLRQSSYQINPAIIHSIWDKRFNNTILATKEFEERLQYMHSLCTDKYLRIYLKNLDKPLYVADELCVKMISQSMFKYTDSKFFEFAARKDGGVMIANGMQQKLSIYFQQKYKAYKDAAERTWAKYQSTLDSLNNIADIKIKLQSIEDFTRNNKNFQEELCSNLHDAYRQLSKTYDCDGNPPLPPAKNYYNVNISSTGWKNLDVYVFDATQSRQSMKYTDSVTGKTATITYKEVNITIEKAEAYDRILVYLLPDSLSSFQRVKQNGSIFKEQLNALFKYDAVVLAYKGTQAYLLQQHDLQPQQYHFTLEPATGETLRSVLNNYSVDKDLAPKKDLDFQLFEQQEAARQMQLLKDMEFRKKIAASIFNCPDRAPKAGTAVVNTKK